LKISKSDESSLIIAFTEAIQASAVTSYTYVSVGQDWVDQTLSAIDQELAQKLELAADGLETFFNREVFKIFFRRGNKVPKQNERRLLSSFKGFEEPLKVAREFVDTLKSIPRQHRAYLQAHPIFSDHVSEAFNVKIGTQLSLVDGASLKSEVAMVTEPEEFQSFLTAGAKRAGYSEELDCEAAYFVYRSSGYVADKYNTRIASDMLDEVRAFYGSALANELFWGFQSSRQRATPFVVINQLDDDKAEFVHASAVDEDIKRASNLLPRSTTVDSLKSGTKVSKLLEPVGHVFTCPEHQRMVTAAIWLLRAHMSHRGMDQILESTIAIEVLLGDRDTSDRIGLSKLMANRCAYALGKSAKERKKPIDFFTRFYRVRSEIVHSGRFKLSRDEEEIVNEGVELASRLLRHEVELSRS
jgi:hypothetical protein